jgi:transposase-like protein
LKEDGMAGRDTIRYSEAFKLQVIGELESGKFDSVDEARRAYGIGGSNTIGKWLRKYGKRNLLGRVIRVEKPQERDQIKVLKARIRELERAVADSKVQEVLSRAYFEIVCEQYGVEDIEGLKKSIARKLSDEESGSAGKRGK